MVTLRRLLSGVLVVLLVSGVAGAQTVPTDTPKIAALRVKANAGDAEAQWALGAMYYDGFLLLQDYGQGVAWYRKAAEQGHAEAQWGLGVAYAFGHGVSKDVGQSVAWTRKAAEQGVAMAQFRLGLAYFLGQGVPEDYVEAHKWLNLAASRADAENQREIAERRAGVTNLMTPAQLAEAQKLAREWLAAFEKRGGK